MVDRRRNVTVALLFVALAAALVGGLVLVVRDGRPGHAGTCDDGGSAATCPARVEGHTDDGWQVVSYADARVDLPSGWTVASTTARGGDGSRLFFYASATFDAATGPGLMVQPDGTWGGYRYAGDQAVFVTDPARSVAARVLASVHRR